MFRRYAPLQHFFALKQLFSAAEHIRRVTYAIHILHNYDAVRIIDRNTACAVRKYGRIFLCQTLRMHRQAAQPRRIGRKAVRKQQPGKLFRHIARHIFFADERTVKLSQIFRHPPHFQLVNRKFFHRSAVSAVHLWIFLLPFGNPSVNRRSSAVVKCRIIGKIHADDLRHPAKIQLRCGLHIVLIQSGQTKLLRHAACIPHKCLLVTPLSLHQLQTDRPCQLRRRFFFKRSFQNLKKLRRIFSVMGSKHRKMTDHFHSQHILFRRKTQYLQLKQTDMAHQKRIFEQRLICFII